MTEKDVMLRFGRKIAVPSTLQIKRELRLMIAADALVEETRSVLKETALSPGQVEELVGHLGLKHAVSRASARALVALVGKRDASRVTPAAA